MTPPCKDCITFVLCKNRFIKRYERSFHVVGRLHGIWFSAADTFRDVSCKKAELFYTNRVVDLKSVIKDAADKTGTEIMVDTNEIQRQVATEILEGFGLQTWLK